MMTPFNRYITQVSPASYTFVLALFNDLSDDVDMMQFLFGYGQ